MTASLQDVIGPGTPPPPGRVGTIMRLGSSNRRAWVALDRSPDVLRGPLIVGANLSGIAVGDRCLIIDADTSASIVVARWTS